MQTLVLQLFNRKNRPSFRYESNNVKVDALLDTGAETPVWCKGEKKLMLAYPEAVKQDWKSEIRGFGKEAEDGAVYVIPEFSLTDGKTSYKITNLQIAVCDHPLIGYDFVMSDTMFPRRILLSIASAASTLKLFLKKIATNVPPKEGLAHSV